VVVTLSAARRLSLLLFLSVAPCVLQAHRLDECLQAAMVIIEPQRVHVQLVLEPGVEVASQVLKRIDRDNNQTISRAESVAYSSALQRELTLRLDGQLLQLRLEVSEFDTPAELRSGSGIIRLTFSAAVKISQPGPHQLVFENRHLSAISVYLFNATQPELPAIRITRQQRNYTQSVGTIDFILTSPG
jgi:polyphosphate kinase